MGAFKFKHIKTLDPKTICNSSIRTLYITKHVDIYQLNKGINKMDPKTIFPSNAILNHPLL